MVKKYFLNMKVNKKAVVFLVIVLLAIIYFAFWGQKDSEIIVSVEKPSKMEIVKKINLSGKIKAVDYQEIFLPAGIKVEELYIDENDFIEKDMALLKLNSEDLLLQLEKAKLNLQQYKSDYNNLINKTNSVNKEFIINSLAKAKEQYDIAKEDFESAGNDLKKSKSLFEEDALSKEEYEKRLLEVNNLERYSNIAKLNFEDTLNQYNNFDIENNFEIQGISRKIKAAELDINILNDEIENNTLISKVSGVVIQLTVKEGRDILPDSKIIILNTDNYDFIAKVSQEDVLSIEKGQKSKIIIDGLTKEYDAEVYKIGKVAQIDDESGSNIPKVEIFIRIKNPDNNITSGFEAEAIVEISKVSDLIATRIESIKKSENDERFVYVAENGFARKTPVKTGVSDDFYTSIISGLKETDLVIINPSLYVEDGIKIKISSD